MLSKLGISQLKQANNQPQLKLMAQKNTVIQFSGLSQDTADFKSQDKPKKHPTFLIEKLHNYINAVKNKIQGNIIIVSGPSGVGKDTVINIMRANNPQISSAISLTTREPRPGEVNGVNYNFMKSSKKYETFEKLISENKLFQYLHSKDNGQYYGITKSELEQKRKGHDAIVNVTADEALRIKEENGDKAVTMFVDAASPAELEARLRARGTEKPEEIEKRIASGKAQRALSPDFDKIIINAKDKQNEAAQAMTDYIDERKDPTLKTLENVQTILENEYDFSQAKETA